MSYGASHLSFLLSMSIMNEDYVKENRKANSLQATGIFLFHGHWPEAG